MKEGKQSTTMSNGSTTTTLTNEHNSELTGKILINKEGCREITPGKMSSLGKLKSFLLMIS